MGRRERYLGGAHEQARHAGRRRRPPPGVAVAGGRGRGYGCAAAVAAAHRSNDGQLGRREGGAEAPRRTPQQERRRRGGGSEAHLRPPEAHVVRAAETIRRGEGDLRAEGGVHSGKRREH